jgi:hypothetical protein
MFLISYYWLHLGPVVWKLQGVTLYQEQYGELVLGSAAVRFNKLCHLKCDCDVILHSGQVQEEAFYVCDIGDIVHKHREWKLKMPRVEPHYGKSGSKMKYIHSAKNECIMEMSCVCVCVSICVLYH